MTVEKIPDDFYERAYRVRNTGNIYDTSVWNLFNNMSRGDDIEQNIIDLQGNNGKLSSDGQKLFTDIRAFYSDGLKKNSDV